MDIQKELLRYQREIAQSLQEQASADKEATVAQNLYDKALANWEAQNAAIVEKKNRTAQAKSDAKKKLEALREEARNLLGNVFIEDLPEGFNQKRSKVVVYDKQGFTRIAHQYFPFLLVLDEAEVQRFFANQAKEADDGALILPENIRAFAAVEVVYKPKPEISDAKLSKLAIETPEETEPLSAVTQAIEVVEAAEEAWTPPANAIAMLTAPNREDLPIIQDYSSEGESIPVSKVFNDDGAWKNAAMWDTEEDELEPVSTLPLSRYGSVPATEDIDF
jgi:hypothetical protein